MRTVRIAITFLMGFFIYSLIEILDRGYSHWTMALTGGVLLTVLCSLFRGAPADFSAPMRYLSGALLITAAELTVGVAVNLYLHWNVWDYTGKPGNLYGQICPQYAGFWYFLSIPALCLSRVLDRRLPDR